MAVTIFANLRINNPDRLQHLKDSLRSFDALSDDWLINIRGTLRLEAIGFLKENLGDRMTLFELLDDKRGWMENALAMLEKARYEYIFFWNEDQINIATQEFLRNAIDEMRAVNADYMFYTHFPHWRGRFDLNAEGGLVHPGKFTDYADLTADSLKILFPVQDRSCIVSSPSVFKKSFLEKLMRLEKNKLPMFVTDNFYRLMTALNRLGITFDQRRGYDLVNKLLLFKLRKFPKETPFELEITQDRLYILPYRVAVPKRELFVCIDDDFGIPGYSLIERGLYGGKLLKRKG
jgi:hypothetical protein